MREGTEGEIEGLVELVRNISVKTRWKRHVSLLLPNFNVRSSGGVSCVFVATSSDVS